MIVPVLGVCRRAGVMTESRWIRNISGKFFTGDVRIKAEHAIVVGVIAAFGDQSRNHERNTKNLDDLFQAYTKYAHLERVKTTNMGTMYELSYRIELRSAAKEKEFIDNIRCRNGNLSIILGLVQHEKNEL